MASPFEEPAKTEMRSRCEIAVDQSGHELVSAPVSVPLPTSAGLNGAIRGDLQSIDGNGVRYCYYLRSRAGDTLPKWLANLAQAAHDIDGVEFYLVTDVASPAFEAAAKAAGAGLLTLDEDNSFTQIIDFRQVRPPEGDEAFSALEQELRRRLEAKVDLKRAEMEKRFNRLGDLTAGMSSDVADKYMDQVEKQYVVWSEWSEATGRELDRAYVTRDRLELKRVEELIEEGPEVDADIV